MAYQLIQNIASPVISTPSTSDFCLTATWGSGVDKAIMRLPYADMYELQFQGRASSFYIQLMHRACIGFSDGLDYQQIVVFKNQMSVSNWKFCDVNYEDICLQIMSTVAADQSYVEIELTLHPYVGSAAYQQLLSMASGAMITISVFAHTTHFMSTKIVDE